MHVLLGKSKLIKGSNKDTRHVMCSCGHDDERMSVEPLADELCAWSRPVRSASNLGEVLLVQADRDIDTRCRLVVMDVAALGLAKVREHWVDELERLVDLLAHLGASEDDLAGDEDEQHNFRLHHAVDETGEQLRLV